MASKIFLAYDSRDSCVQVRSSRLQMVFALVNGGFHLYIFVLAFINQFYSRMASLFQQSVANGGSRAMNCMHECLWKTHSQDCPHREIRHSYWPKSTNILLSAWMGNLPCLSWICMSNCPISIDIQFQNWSEVVKY